MTRRIRPGLLLAAILGLLSVGPQSPRTAPPRGLVDPVNMSIKDGVLYVSDRATGVHVYDVVDPATPSHRLTIPLKYNRGTAVKDDILYANDRGSLLAIRIEGDTYEVVNTIYHEPSEPLNDVVIDRRRDSGFYCACMTADEVVAPQSSPSTGSSFATFAVIDDYLYYVDHSTLVTADISQADDPKPISRTLIGWGVETLYPTQAYLFVGGQRGMYIFNRSDPAAPRLVGKMEHFRACDPVVVSGSIAYVTLRGGNRCGQTRDVLLCVDIEDPTAPELLSEKPMDTPYGLSFDDHWLYVSTGPSGYTLLDVSAPADPSRVKSWSEWPTKDFIWESDVLYALGFDGLVIFDVSTPDDPVMLSTIDS